MFSSFFSSLSWVSISVQPPPSPDHFQSTVLIFHTLLNLESSENRPFPDLTLSSLDALQFWPSLIQTLSRQNPFPGLPSLHSSSWSRSPPSHLSVAGQSTIATPEVPRTRCIKNQLVARYWLQLLPTCVKLDFIYVPAFVFWFRLCVSSECFSVKACDYFFAFKLSLTS